MAEIYLLISPHELTPGILQAIAHISEHTGAVVIEQPSRTTTGLVKQFEPPPLKLAAMEDLSPAKIIQPQSPWESISKNHKRYKKHRK